MLASFIVGLVLAVFGGAASVVGFFFVYRSLSKNYARFLQNARKLSYAKRELLRPSGKENKMSVSAQLKRSKRVYLEQGLFSSRIVEKDTSLDEMTSLEQKKEQKEFVNNFSLSFFGAPALYIDHTRRKFTNSLNEFLAEVPESKPNFLRTDFKTTSVLVVYG